MDETATLGVQKRIDYLGRWSLAFFTVAAVLVGWLGARFDAEKFGIVFEVGLVGLAVIIVIDVTLVVATVFYIKRLEEHKHV